MNADEASRIAYQVITSNDNKQKEEILSRIRHAAEKGRYQIYMEYLKPEIIAWLKFKGYSVTTYNQYNDSGTSISWGKHGL